MVARYRATAGVVNAHAAAIILAFDTAASCHLPCYGGVVGAADAQGTVSGDGGMWRAEDIQHYRIEDARQAFEFDGQRIAGPRDNRIVPRTRRRRPRYLVAELYLTAAGFYILHRVNNSDVYHEKSARCDLDGRSSKLWLPSPVTDLASGAVPCNLATQAGQVCCYPPLRETRASLSGAIVLRERPRPRIDTLPTWGALIQVVSQAKHRREGFTSVVVTGLLEELLREAEARTGVFAGPKPVTKIA